MTRNVESMHSTLSNPMASARTEACVDPALMLAVGRTDLDALTVARRRFDDRTPARRAY